MPAEKILSDAICAQVRSSLLAFIKMKELPQMMHIKINIPQLTSLSFFMLMRKGHYSVSEQGIFFILWFIQNTGMAKISLKEISTRAPKDFEKDSTKKKTSDIVNELDDLQNLLFAEGKRSVLIILQGQDASG